jgi:hypothetical protein
MIYFCRDIDAPLQGIPSTIAVIALNIGPGNIEGDIPGLLLLKMEVPYQGDYYSTCPAYA